MIYISLDPSYTRTGICILNDETKIINFETASCKIGEKKFLNIYSAAYSIVNQLNDLINKYTLADNKKQDYVIVSEEPLPCSSMSSALYALDILILDKFFHQIKKTYNPATLTSKIHGHKYTKKESVDLAQKYIENLKEKNYHVEGVFGNKRKIPHDCCEAFLYLHYYLHTESHHDFDFDNEDEKRLYDLRKKNLKKKEKELLS